MKIKLIFASILLVSACSSNEEKMAKYNASCAGYGYAPGTPEMAMCVSTEASEAAERRRAAMMAIGNGMAGFSAGYNQNRSVTCTTIGFTTTCR